MEHLAYLWGKVLSGTFSLLVGVLGSYVYDELSEPKGSSLELNLEDLLRPSSLGPLLLFAALIYLLLEVLRFFVQRAQRRHEARGGFDLIEPTSKLSPEHLGFQVIKPGEPVSLDQRPFYESVYVHRITVPYHERANENPQTEYEETQLVQSLERGRSFVLLGPPLDGKSRTLYEILRSLEDHVVVVPKVNEKVPSDETFSFLLKGRRVVLLLDDLTRYVDTEVNLREFWQRLGHHASSRVVASTCRDNPELSAVRDGSKQSLQWFYDRIPLKLAFIEASSEEKQCLAEAIGDAQKSHRWEEFPNLGHVVMEDSMNQMRGRFERLSHQSPEQVDALRSLKLLADAGVLPFTQQRLLASMRGVFERSPSHLGDCLYTLAEQSFLTLGAHDLVDAEPAYLRYVVTYPSGRKPEDYFPELANVLEALGDTEGMFYLGTTYAVGLGDYEEARECFDRAVHLRPDDPTVWRDRAAALRKWLEHLSESHTLEEVADVIKEALRAYEEAIRLAPDISESWLGKGAVLQIATRYQEAIDAFDKAIKLEPDFHDAWCDRGMALVWSDRHQEALDTLDRAIHLDPSCPQAWMNKGKAMFAMASWQQGTERSWEASECHEKALEAYEMATNLDPYYFEAWMRMGEVLTNLERYEEALKAFHKATAIKPDDHEAWEWKGRPLVELKQYEEYGKVTEKALSLDPDCHLAWMNRGLAHYHLGRPWVEVAQCYDKAISLRPDDPVIWSAKADYADASGWPQEAVNAFDRALSLKSDFPKALLGRGVSLAVLGRYQEALKDLNRAIDLRPDEPEYLETKSRVLRRMGRHEEAQKAFDKAMSLKLE